MGKTADLERAGAALARAKAKALEAIDPSEARKLLEAADLGDAYADACDEWDAVRTNLDATREQIKSAKGRLHELRATWRLYGETAGTRKGLVIENNTEG